MIAEINHVEPAPRRVRAMLGGEIFDTTRARYVWEWPYYPQYYIPAEDIDPRFLVDEHHEQHLGQGTARRHGLRAGSLDRPGTVRVFGAGAIDGVAGTARFDWDALDAWYEEDEQVFVHPRNPYVRVDALRSRRHVRVALEGVTLAETTTPVLVFETGLPPATTSIAPMSTSPIWCPPTQTPARTRASPAATGRCGPVTVAGPPGPCLGLRLPDPPAAAHRRPGRLLQRKGRHRPRRPPAAAGPNPLLQMTTTIAMRPAS